MGAAVVLFLIYILLAIGALCALLTIVALGIVWTVVWVLDLGAEEPAA